MFAPMILPLQLTCVLIVILFVVIVVSPLGRSTRRQRIGWFLLGSPFLFIAAILIVGFLVDAVRYRTFQYAQAADIRDPYVRLPKSATNVTVNKYASGHEARFSVTKAELLSWFDEEWKRVCVYSQPRNNADYQAGHPEASAQTGHTLDPRFETLGWEPLPDVVYFCGPVSGRGGGFTVYYSESRQLAYLRHAYW
ncbi:MAG: hypothetical protein SH850_13865 [Planctomycetaceae bacterium]|nr:hypothetical protein [Planctomycetaceae bacterium]